MNHTLKRMLAAALVASMFATTGCIGSFKLVKTIYEFNRGIANKWVGELAFLGLFFIPVYLVCSLGDAFIFNVIEFWSGTSPLAERDVEVEDGRRIHLAKSADGKTLTIEDRDSGETRTYTRDGDDLRIADGAGNQLALLRPVAGGQIEVQDGAGKVVALIDAALASDAVRAALAGDTRMPDPLLAARAALR